MGYTIVETISSYIHLFWHNTSVWRTETHKCNGYWLTEHAALQRAVTDRTILRSKKTGKHQHSIQKWQFSFHNKIHVITWQDYQHKQDSQSQSDSTCYVSEMIPFSSVTITTGYSYNFIIHNCKTGYKVREYSCSHRSLTQQASSYLTAMLFQWHSRVWKRKWLVFIF